MAGSTIKVGMDIGDVKAAGMDLIKQLQGQVDATLELAQAQVKYNSAGKEVAQVLKGLTESGDRYTVTLKQTSSGYELVNAQINKSKSALTEQITKQKEAAAAAKEEQRAIEAKAAASKKMLDLMAVAQPGGGIGRDSLIRGMSVAGQQQAAANAPPPTPPRGFFTGGADAFSDSTNKANRASERLFITWQGIVRLIEAQVIKRIINEIGNALSNAVSDAKSFSISIAEIRTISDEAPLSIQKWREEITKLSSAFGQTQKDVANAVYETLSNQVAKGAETFDFLSSAMKFGAATVSSTTDSVNLLSSALKSFNLPVQDTERVAAILFKTIDLGRVRARDLADTFGRVGSIASQAGVKIEEVGAAISVITRRGVKPADSMTIISNMITALLKPTEDMKKLLAEWGVTTGEAAIATFGFEGVLKKLGDEASKGSSRLAELFPNVRGLRGAFQLAGQGASEFQEDLRKNTTAQKQYNDAAKEVLSSPGKQLEIAGQRIKNLFTEDFGKVAVETLVKMNNLLETSTGKADGLERSIKLVIKGLTLAAGVLTTIKILQIANITTTLSWRDAVSMLAVDLTRIAGIMASIAPYAAIAAAAFVTAQAISNGNDIGRSSGEIAANVSKEQDDRRAALKKKIEEDGDPTQQNLQKLKTDLDSRFQYLLQYTTNAVKLGNELKQRTIDNYKDITDAVKISSKTYFDSILAKISELKRASSEAETLIRQSLKVTEDMSRKTTQSLFDARMKYASDGRLESPNGNPTIVDNQKVDLLQNRIAALLVEARAKTAEGTKEAFEESRKLYNDVQQLTNQLFEAKTNSQKRIFDERVSRGMEQPTRMTFDTQSGELKAQYEFKVKTTDLEKQLNELGKERLASEREFRTLQRQRADDAAQEIAREKERLRGLQQAFAAIEKINVFNQEGKLKSEYKTPGGADRATREFDEQATKIKSLAGQEGFGTQYQVFQDLQKQRLALVQQVEAAIRQEQVTTSQQSLIRSKEGTQRLIDSANTQQNQGRQKVTEGMEQLERDLAIIEERTLRRQEAVVGKIGGIAITAGGESLFEKMTGIGLDNFSGKKSAVARSEPDRQAALEALKAVKDAQAAFNADQTVEKMNIVKQKLTELQEAARKYIETFTGHSADNEAEQGDKTYRTQGDRLRALNFGPAVSEEGLGTATAANAQLEQAKNSITALDDKIKGLPGGVDFFARRVAEQGPAINESFQGFTNSALTLTDQMKALNTELEKAGQLLPQIKGNREAMPQVEGNFFGGVPGRGHFFGGEPKSYNYGGPVKSESYFFANEPKSYNYGGPVKSFGGKPKYFAHGGPVGSDDVPAWLNKDEFVMTGAATKAFSPILKQMNAYPSRAGVSGNSTTSVGDINITVNGGSTSAHTIQEIGVGLRRAIARGTVKLHG